MQLNCSNIGSLSLLLSPLHSQLLTVLGMKFNGSDIVSFRLFLHVGESHSIPRVLGEGFSGTNISTFRFNYMSPLHTQHKGVINTLKRHHYR